MTRLISQDKTVHWAEAFGLSAAAHVGLAYLLITTVVDITAVFPAQPEPPTPLQITSLSVETGTLSDVSSPGSGLTETVAGAATVTSVDPSETLAPVDMAQDSASAVPEAIPTPEPPTSIATLSPLRPETPTIAPVLAPQQVLPLQPLQPNLPNPPAAAQAPAPAHQPPDPLAADLINRIRANVGETCLIAIPQQIDGVVSLAIYTADEAAIAPYLADVFAGLSPPPPAQTTLLDPRQCAALDYIRQSAAYPAMTLGVGLAADRIATGETLAGTIANTGGRALSLLIVDDNGVTQTLNAYVTSSANTARFAAPLRRASTARDTRQLLIALGTTTPPATVTSQNGQSAEIYFSALAEEIGSTAAIALVPFDVR